jgi:hypothetical protein
MYTDIKTFEDACRVLNLESEKIIPDFSLFPETDREAMIAHAKLIIIAKAINGDWTPDWADSSQWKYYPWFEMGSSSGVGFSADVYDFWDTGSSVGSRLCFENREKAKYVGKQFQELYKIYFVK